MRVCSRVTCVAAAVLASLAWGCAPPTTSSEQGNRPSVQSGVATLPVLAWWTADAAWFRVLNTDGTDGPMHDVGTSFFPLGFFPQRDTLVMQAGDALKVTRLSDGRTERYVEVAGASLVAATGSRDGARVVAVFQDAGGQGTQRTGHLLETRVDAQGAASAGTVLEEDDLDVESSNLHLHGNELLLVNGSWAPPEAGMTDARRVVAVNLDAGTTRVLFTPSEEEDLLYVLPFWRGRLVAIWLRPHTNTGSVTEAHWVMVNLDTGAAVEPPGGTLLTPYVATTSDVDAAELPWGVLDAAGDVRAWEPWNAASPLSEPLVHLQATAAWAFIVGRAVVVGERAPDGASIIRVVSATTGATTLEHREDPPTESGYVQAIPLFAASDGSALVVARTYTNGSDFYGGLGQRYMHVDGTRLDVGNYGSAFSHVLVEGLPDAGTMQFYEVRPDTGALVKTRSAPLFQALFRQPGWSSY